MDVQFCVDALEEAIGRYGPPEIFNTDQGMTAVKALRMAHDSAIRLGIAGADLILDAEREPAPAVLETIRRNKEGIVALLAADYDGWTAEAWQ